jgi:hypothetical protein
MVHITDLFFHAEISRVLGKDASDIWISEQQDLNMPSNRPSSPLTPKLGFRALAAVGNSRKSCDTTSHHLSLPTYDSIDTSMQTTDAWQILSEVASPDRSSDPDLSNNIGLLFTDAAHVVLQHCVRAKSA